MRPQQAREILEQFKWPLILLSDSADHDPSQLAVTKEDIQTHFKEARGTIAEVKLMNGFGFIEYQDAMDARDVVPGKCRPNIFVMGHTLIVLTSLP